MKFFLLLALAGLVFSCNTKTDTADPVAIYYNGDILTMRGDEPEYVEALVVAEDTIAFTGSLKEATSKFSNHKKYDLSGKTLMPGFIDAHAHFAAFPAQAIGAQILPPPDATASNIPILIDILKKWATPENIELTGWIFGIGFDDSVLEEKRFPTRDDLDNVSLDIPVMIVHISGHFAAVNSKGLELLNITAKTPDPEGGVIRRIAGSKEPNGVLEELAAIPYMLKVITPKNEKVMFQFLQAGQEMALSYGYTTAQEGRAMLNTHLFLVQAAKTNQLKLDVVSYLDYTLSDSLLSSPWLSSKYSHHYRVGGLKITLDGSPQGRTAWRTTPYLIPPEGKPNTYRGYPAIPKDKVVEAIYEKCYKNNWQVLTHANGDAAIDQMIGAMKKVSASYDTKPRRDVLIHGQYVRPDQLDSFKELNVITSLFPLHTFYWGDWHKKLIGDSLGNYISPSRTAINKGLKITIHTDAPVALPNLMRMVWTATNRVSRSGAIIGESERLTTYEALKCITDWSAYQHFEEDRKGTLETGKLADFVVLDANPMKVNPDAVKDIVVLETIKKGNTVYKRTGNGEVALHHSPNK